MIKFREFITLQRGFDLPKKMRRNGTFPVVASTSVQGFHDEYKVQTPGVVTGRSGSLGQVLFIEQPFWPLNTTLWVKDFKGNNPRYVYYHLQTLGLEHYNSGAGVPTLNRNHLNEIEVEVHVIESQQKIAAILSTYDDLIENNLRRIKILEEMAQNLYREWFVKFRFPGHEQVRMIDSPRGKIPEKWEVVQLRDFASIDKGISYKGSFLTDDGLPMVNLKCISSGGGFRHAGTKPYSGDHKPRHRVIPGDLVFANTDLTQAGNIIGSPAIVPRRGFKKGGLASHHICIVRPMKQSPLNQIFLFHLFQSGGFRDYAKSHASGTTVLGFRSDDALNFSFPMPPTQIKENFETIARNKFQLCESLMDRNLALRQTRDLLLPKLISGELDVSELDIDIGEAA